eukprot:2540591-Pleurochrysis_carterae.AAC.1
MDCSYGMGVSSVSSKMYSKDTLAIRPERVIENVSMRLNDDLYRSERGPKGGSPIYWPDLIGICHWHYLSKRLVCISPIQRVPIYDVSYSANLYYMPSDGLSTRDAHPDGYGHNSALHSLISLITPEYESPGFRLLQWPMLYPAP